MKSGAEPRTSPFVRGSGLLDRVDYRSVETPAEKDCIYLMRYRAYLHSGLILQSESRRVSDRYDDAPNAWTFGIYVDGELCSSLPRQSGGCPLQRNCSATFFTLASIKAKFSSIRLVLLQTLRRPGGSRSFPI